MRTTDTVIAEFADHDAAEPAVKKLTAAGFDMSHLSAACGDAAWPAACCQRV